MKDCQTKDEQTKEDRIKQVLEQVKLERQQQEQLETNPKKIDRLYFHIGNSGITFAVIDEGHGATLEITGSSFGNMESSLKLHTNADGLKQLGDMLINAANHTYSPEYVHSAIPPIHNQQQSESKNEKEIT